MDKINKRKLEQLRGKLSPTKPGTVGYQYLESQGLQEIASQSLMARKIAYDGKDSQSLHPALVFPIRKQGKTVAALMIYLTNDGKLLNVGSDHPSMIVYPESTILDGAAITFSASEQCDDAKESELVIATSITDAMAARVEFGCKVICPVSNNNLLQHIQIEDVTSSLRIIVENTINWIGHAAAYVAAVRFHKDGRNLLVNTFDFHESYFHSFQERRAFEK